MFGFQGGESVEIVARIAGHANKEIAARLAHHYDIGNDLYEAFLDDEMVYSCAFFTPEAQSLDAAQGQDLAPTTAKPSPSPLIVSLGTSGRPR